MNCPECRSFQLYVVDTRVREQTIKRRRVCQDCGCRFSTREVVEEEYESLERRCKMLNSFLPRLIKFVKEELK